MQISSIKLVYIRLWQVGLSDKERLEKESYLDPISSCESSCDGELGCIASYKFQETCSHSRNCAECRAIVEAELGVAVYSWVRFCGFEIGELRQVLICEKKFNNRLLYR